MFLNRFNGMNNRSGVEIHKRRQIQRISQRELADRMTELGLEVDKNAIQRIESGLRFVTDIELVYFARYFKCSIPELIFGEEGRQCQH